VKVISGEVPAVSNDQGEDLVAQVVQNLRDGGASVVPYDASKYERAKAAVRRAEEIIGLPIEVLDSGIQDEGYGMLRLRVESLVRVPDFVVRAYEEAHRSQDAHRPDQG
jgi:hypothetical protein